ncbi:MAG: response regulator [Thermodesulfobacteriota bacterium]
MATILIVDDDLGLQKILGLSLQKYCDDFAVLFAENGEEAIKVLDRQAIDLLVTDIKMPKMDGLSLLSHMSIKHPAIPCIVLTSYTIPGLEQKLSGSIFRFLKKPVMPDNLAALVQEGLEQSAKDGGLSGVSISGLMQIIEAEEKTCLLAIHTDGKEQGAMYFHEGDLYDAVYGKLQGEEAALPLIALDNVRLDYRKLPARKIQRRITSGMQALILEAMRIKDEKAAMAADGQEEQVQQQDWLLSQGITLCKGFHLRKAQKVLLKLASETPKNMHAWLWLSRTVNNMKQLRAALARAYQLEPQDRDVVHDIKMFKAASKLKLAEIRRCPFCYAPIGLKATNCHFCGATLAISKKSLAQIGDRVNRNELRGALDRFEEILTVELNIPVLFYAALACLHLDDFDAALEYLEQLQQCLEPEESTYSAAVDRIVAFLAARGTVEEGEKAPARETPQPGREEGSKQKKVLVVEDSSTTRKVIKMTLQSNNFNVIEAEDGVEALTRINDEHPDLVLLDVMLPKLDGYGILSVLKQNSKLKSVPVIMLTSKDGLKDKIKGKFSSASAYLTKPFKPEMLIQKVNQYMQ